MVGRFDMGVAKASNVMGNVMGMAIMYRLILHDWRGSFTPESR
jgi:hypothetical protein